MRQFVNKIRSFTVQKLMPDDISIKHRLCNLIYASTLIGTVGTFLVSALLTPSPMTLLTIGVAMVVISISLYLSVHFRKHTLAAIIIIFFVDEIIFPVMYYANGGIHSGMQIWFVIGLMFAFLVLDGKWCVITYIMGSVTLGACFLLEQAGVIQPTPLEGNVWVLDVIQSLVLVGLIFGVFFKLQTYIYTKQNNALMQKEKELLEAMEKVEAANRAKSDFLANMSHEIRTPINAIMGMNEIILRDSTDEETLDNAKRIQAASNNLLSTVNNILDFSKIESGKMEIINEDYMLSSLLNDCYNMINLRAYNKGLSFKLVNDPSIPENLTGDQFHIFQVVSNVLTNAVKYTKEGVVELAVSYKKISVDCISLIFEIKDSGVGIAEDDKEKLFQNFQRIDEKNNRSIEGTGLGLAIVARLVEQMDGVIEVSSELGKGSTFTIMLPQLVRGNETIGDFSSKCEENQSQTVEKKNEIFTAPSARILVVDDVKVNLTVVKGLLKKTQIQIDTALSGEDALKLTDENKYDLMFFDHMMPKMDGIETLHALKERQNQNQDTPVIVLTANAIKGVEEEYKKEGFDGYLSKPTSGVDLENTLLKYLPAQKVER